jgi:hypothetical protein
MTFDSNFEILDTSIAIVDGKFVAISENIVRFKQIIAECGWTTKRCVLIESENGFEMVCEIVSDKSIISVNTHTLKWKLEGIDKMIFLNPEILDSSDTDYVVVKFLQ